MNKNIVATTSSLGLVALAFGVFYAVTPPLKTGGLSPLKAHTITQEFSSASPEATDLLIDRARNVDGILAATFTLGDSSYKYETDSSNVKPDTTGAINTGALSSLDHPEKAISLLAAMRFEVKNKPSLVFTFGGDYPFQLAKQIKSIPSEKLVLDDCYKLIANTDQAKEKAVTYKVQCDVRFDQAVSAITQHDKVLTAQAALSQSYIASTGALKYLVEGIGDDSWKSIQFKPGSTITVFYKTDEKAMDRGINFAYKPGNSGS